MGEGMGLVFRSAIAVLVAGLALASPAGAEETPKRGGTLTYMIPADAPRASPVLVPAKFPTRRFLPSLANPFNWIYKKAILDKDPHWYEKNILGTGPFKFAHYETGQSVTGVRNPDYYQQDLPYLDGFVAIYADKQATRVDAIRGDRAAIEFRGMPPAARDELVSALGDKIMSQEGIWHVGSAIT